jgi:hypothetical protein
MASVPGWWDARSGADGGHHGEMRRLPGTLPASVFIHTMFCFLVPQSNVLGKQTRGTDRPRVHAPSCS